MNLKIDKHEQYSILTLEDDKLNSLVAPELKSEFVSLTNKGHKNLVLDLSGVRYVDSSGLSALLVGHRICGELNGTFVLAGLQEPVKKLISISQLDTVLNLLGTLQEGVDYVLMEEVARDIDEEEED